MSTTSEQKSKPTIYQDRLDKLICGFGYNQQSKNIVPKDVSLVIQDLLNLTDKLEINVIYSGTNWNTADSDQGMAKFEVYLNEFVAKIVSLFIDKYTLKYCQLIDKSILTAIEDQEDEIEEKNSDEELKIDTFESKLNLIEITSDHIYGQGEEIYDQDGNGNCLSFLDIDITKRFLTYLYKVRALDEDDNIIFESKWKTKMLKYWNHETIIKFNEAAVNTFFNHAIDINKNEFVTVNEWVQSLSRSYEFQKKTKLTIFDLQRIYYLILSISKDDIDDKAGLTATDFCGFMAFKGYKGDKYGTMIKYFMNHIPYFNDIQ